MAYTKLLTQPNWLENLEMQFPDLSLTDEVIYGEELAGKLNLKGELTKGSMKLKIKHTLEEFLLFTIIVFLLISLVVGATIIGKMIIGWFLKEI